MSFVRIKPPQPGFAPHPFGSLDFNEKGNDGLW
jgi:hypothetical protein